MITIRDIAGSGYGAYFIFINANQASSNPGGHEKSDGSGNSGDVREKLPFTAGWPKIPIDVGFRRKGKFGAALRKTEFHGDDRKDADSQ